jgi:UrcA family protein
VLKEITMLRIFTAAALLALTATTAAQAENWARDSMPVAYGDLNLSKPADAKVLAERLQAAATKVCLSATSDLRLNANSDLTKSREMQDCVDTAINVAMLRIEHSMTAHVRANLINSKQASLN